MTDLLIPLLCAAVGLSALRKQVDITSAFSEGAVGGMETLLRIFPALLLLLPMIAVLRASGLLDALTKLFSPLLTLFGIPPETAPLLFLRPFSGSGALAVATELMSAYGVDSLIGRTAAVMLGSTETTFYVLTVYTAGSGGTDPKRILPAALLADFVGFTAAALTVQLWFG